MSLEARGLLISWRVGRALAGLSCLPFEAGCTFGGEIAVLPQSEEAQQKDDDDNGTYDVNETVHERYL